MSRTLEETNHVYEAAKELMSEREKDYEGSWRREGIGSAAASGFKKASQIDTMYKNGRIWENPIRSKEDALDLINYGVFIYRFIELGPDGHDCEKDD